MMKLDIDDIEDARKAIKWAWIAGVISAGFTSVLAVVAIVSDGSVLGGVINGWSLIDAFIMFGLAYGVYRKSKGSAIALLVYYVLNQVLVRLDGNVASGIGLVVVFTLVFVQGVRGTFAYHAFKQEESEQDSEEEEA